MNLISILAITPENDLIGYVLDKDAERFREAVKLGRTIYVRDRSWTAYLERDSLEDLNTKEVADMLLNDRSGGCSETLLTDILAGKLGVAEKVDMYTFVEGEDEAYE